MIQKYIPRIMERCEEDGDCLLWTSSEINGFPRFTVRDERGARTIQPRRVMWEQAKGPIPKGLVVTVTCGNSMCLNHQHMELITKGEVISRTAKKPDVNRRRHLAGLVRRKDSNMTLELARYIRSSSATGADLSRELGIPPTTISAIRLNKRWREVIGNPFAALFTGLAANDSKGRRAA